MHAALTQRHGLGARLRPVMLELPAGGPGGGDVYRPQPKLVGRQMVGVLTH